MKSLLNLFALVMVLGVFNTAKAELVVSKNGYLYAVNPLTAELNYVKYNKNPVKGSAIEILSSNLISASGYLFTVHPQTADLMNVVYDKKPIQTKAVAVLSSNLISANGYLYSVHPLTGVLSVVIHEKTAVKASDLILVK